MPSKATIQAYGLFITTVGPFALVAFALVGLMFDLLGPEDTDILTYLLGTALAGPVLTPIVKKVTK